MTDIEYLKKYLTKDQLSDGLRRLHEGEPVQYIVGNVDFYGINLQIDKRVLIPRFETEELVYKTINYIEKYFDKPVTIADIGTGSGCIAITLKKKLQDSIIDAIDISKDALDVAKKNAILNDVSINFFLGNLLNPLKQKYDIIISNPPYISYDEEIMPIVKNNEPSLALFADNEGIYFYEQILKNVSEYLNKKSLIAFEIGSDQAKIITEIANIYFPNSDISIEQDMQGKDRFVFIFNK